MGSQVRKGEERKKEKFRLVIQSNEIEKGNRLSYVG
jgi:hypothetical protein